MVSMVPIVVVLDPEVKYFIIMFIWSMVIRKLSCPLKHLVLHTARDVCFTAAVVDTAMLWSLLEFKIVTLKLSRYSNSGIESWGR